MISPFLRMRGFLRFAVLTVVFLLTVQSASAQTNLVFDTAGKIIGNYVGPSSVAADWVYSGGASGAARAVSSGVVAVGTGVAAADIAVPTVLGATFTAARVAGIALKVARAGSIVGNAFTAWQVYNAIRDSGIATCPPPAFFCVPDPTVSTQVITMYHLGGASGSTLAITQGKINCTGWAGLTAGGTYGQQMQCLSGGNAGVYYDYRVDTTACPVGEYVLNGVCVAGTMPLVPAADSDITASVAAKLASDSTFAARVLNAARTDMQNSPGVAPVNSLAPSDLPIDVTAAPVTGPSTVVGTSTVPNADGSTSTTTTSQQSTVTPHPTGTTIADTNVKYDVTTTTTNTTVNNVTNVTTITTTTDNHPANSPAPSAPTVPFPTDYNREVTQQKIETELKGDGAPVLPDQKVLVDASKTANDTGIGQAVTDAKSEQLDKSAWFSWVWTPPSGSCSPFAGTVHGYAISWDLCPTIANINSVIGWLFALLGAITTYGQLFRKGDDS